MKGRTMLSLFRLWSVAVYEAKQVARSKLFKVFLASSLLPGGIYLGSITSMHQYTALPSAFFSVFLYFFFPFLGAFTLFAAEESLDRERRTDSAPMIRVRPFRNWEYGMGKALGVFLAMLGGVFAFLFVMGVLGLVFRGVSPAPSGILLVPLLMAAPAIATLVGAAFLVSTLVRSRAVTLTMLAGMFVWITFPVGNSWHGLLDYAALRMPLLYSDFTGFGDLRALLLHRGAWLLAGTALMLAAAFRTGRLPSSRWERIAVFSLSVLFLAGAGALGGVYRTDIRAGRELRSRLLTLSRDTAKKPRVTVTGCALNLRHRRKDIEVEAALQFSNTTGGRIDRYMFSLNTGLKVTAVSRNGADVGFTRDLHLLTVVPDTPLAPGAADSLVIRYRGRIDERACHFGVPEGERETAPHYTRGAAKRYGFITPDYVLLTPECGWYPVSGTSSPESTVRDFTRFSLRVETREKLTAISQGDARTVQRGVWVFAPEAPLPQISLAIGDYRKKAVAVDGVEYTLLVKTGHDSFLRYFPSLRPELPSIIREFREYYEGYTGRSYPFRHFALVETPVHFYSYRKPWSPYMETVQPEIVFLPEMGIYLHEADFRRRDAQLRRSPRVRTPEEIQAALLKGFVRTVLFSKTLDQSFMDSYQRTQPRKGWSLISSPGYYALPYNLNVFPNFYHFTNAVASEKHPLLDPALDLYLYGKTPNLNSNQDEYEIVSAMLNGRSPEEALSSPELRGCGPEIMRCAASVFFHRLGSQITERQLNDFLVQFLDASRGSVVPADSLFAAFRSRFGMDMESAAAGILSGRWLPACIVLNAWYHELPGAYGSRFQVRFVAWNPNPVDGTFAAGVNLETNEWWEPGLDHRRNRITRYFTIPAGTAREVGIFVDRSFHRSLLIETLLSENRPGMFYLPIAKENHEPGFVPYEGTRPLDRPPSLTAPGEFLVDNGDPGFEILPGPEPNPLRKLLNGKSAEGTEYRKSGWWYQPPKTWRTVVTSEFFGPVKKSACVVTAGKGKRSVRWTADLPEPGKYEVFFRTPDTQKGFPMPMMKTFAADFHFRVRCEEGMEEREADLRNRESGWISLGTYRFPAGPAVVELSDESKGVVVFADAVKWVKRDTGKE